MVCFRKMIQAAVLREDPKGESPDEKRCGNKGGGDRNEERCDTTPRGKVVSRKSLDIRGEFHFTCATFKMASKHPGGNVQKKTE